MTNTWTNLAVQYLDVIEKTNNQDISTGELERKTQ